MEEAQISATEESHSETCSREEDMESDPEFEMQGQALPVAPFDIRKVDTSVVPLTSQEYLQQVIAERAKLPRVVTATVPKLEISVPKSNLCIFPDEEIVDSPHKPHERWQKQRIFYFSNLRYRIQCNKESWGGTFLANLPDSKTRWFEFLFEEKSCNDIDLLQQPYLDIVLQINHVTTENVIKYIIEWICENKIPVYKGGMWLFALLACIEVPICIRLMAKLRNFVLQCREMRKKIDLSIEKNKFELIALNLFICLIGKYFGQHDLAD